jgi:hypothetical protein
LGPLISKLEVPEVACKVGLRYGIDQLYRLDDVDGSVLDGLVADGYWGGIEFIE